MRPLGRPTSRQQSRQAERRQQHSSGSSTTHGVAATQSAWRGALVSRATCGGAWAVANQFLACRVGMQECQTYRMHSRLPGRPLQTHRLPAGPSPPASGPALAKRVPSMDQPTQHNCKANGSYTLHRCRRACPCPPPAHLKGTQAVHPHLKGAEAVHPARLDHVELGTVIQRCALPQNVLAGLQPVAVAAMKTWVGVQRSVCGSSGKAQQATQPRMPTGATARGLDQAVTSKLSCSRQSAMAASCSCASASAGNTALLRAWRTAPVC